jgi:phytoene/squalene synthetase
MNAVARVAEPRVALPSAAAISSRAGGENFAVASRLLPRAQREHLLALYGFARLADELGDEIEGDRLAALDWLERELDLAYAGAATHPLLRRLEPTLVACRSESSCCTSSASRRRTGWRGRTRSAPRCS